MMVGQVLREGMVVGQKVPASQTIPGVGESKLHVVPGRSSETTSAYSINAATNQITVQMPPCLLGTSSGDQLATRILSDEWIFQLKSEIDPAWLVPTPPDTMQAMQRQMRKAKEKPSRKCVVCQTATSIKCQGCKEVYYCTTDCQKADWKQHKKKCKMPPLSIQEQVLIAAPDCQCFWQYQHALIAVCSDEHVGIKIMSRDRFAEIFGDDAAKRTLTTLATTGKPFQYLTGLYGQVGCTN